LSGLKFPSLLISTVFDVSALVGSNLSLFIRVARSFFVSHLSAAKAALQPLPAAVTPCRHSESATSPAA